MVSRRKALLGVGTVIGLTGCIEVNITDPRSDSSESGEETQIEPSENSEGNNQDGLDIPDTDELLVQEYDVGIMELNLGRTHISNGQEDIDNEEFDSAIESFSSAQFHLDESIGHFRNASDYAEELQNQQAESETEDAVQLAVHVKAAAEHSEDASDLLQRDSTDEGVDALRKGQDELEKALDIDVATVEYMAEIVGVEFP